MQFIVISEYWYICIYPLKCLSKYCYIFIVEYSWTVIEWRFWYTSLSVKKLIYWKLKHHITKLNWNAYIHKVCIFCTCTCMLGRAEAVAFRMLVQPLLGPLEGGSLLDGIQARRLRMSLGWGFLRGWYTKRNPASPKHCRYRQHWASGLLARWTWFHPRTSNWRRKHVMSIEHTLLEILDDVSEYDAILSQYFAFDHGKSVGEHENTCFSRFSKQSRARKIHRKSSLSWDLFEIKCI
jgi:hypothetical protein